jgi:hypothetical protein
MRIFVRCFGSSWKEERDFDSARRAARVACVPTEGWEADVAGARFLMLAIVEIIAFVHRCQSNDRRVPKDKPLTLR